MQRKVLSIFLQLAAKFLPPPFNLLVGILLDYLVEMLPKVAPNGGPQELFAAPDQLKEWLTNLLTTAANEIQSRILRRLVHMLLPMVNTLADELWDKLFDQNVVSEPLSAFGKISFRGTPPVLTATSYEELEAEALEDLK